MSVRNISLYAGDFQIKTSTVSVGQTAALLVSPNGDRWALMFGAGGAAGYNVGPAPDVSSTIGLQVPPGAQPLTIDFARYGALSQGTWYGARGPTLVTAYIVEVVYVPRSHSGESETG